jgi:diguanylate cyclase (GGDEF)-like protein
MERVIRVLRKIIYEGITKNNDQRRLVMILLAFSFALSLLEANLNADTPHHVLLYAFAGVAFISLMFAYRNILFPGRVLTPFAAFVLITIFLYESGIHDESIGGYYLLLLIAGLLLGDTGSMVFGMLSTAAIVVIGFAQYNGLIIGRFGPLTDATEIATTALLMVGTTFILHYIVYRLNLEAKNAHQSEQAQLLANESLRKLQAELEERVEHRTAELQAANQAMSKQLQEIKELRGKLQEEAIRDPLTGLFNRRYLEETLAREFSRARRENYDISFMLLDIDHFKRFNDRYGHAAGDFVLKVVAQRLSSRARAAGIPCRMGGEEFLLVLPCIVDEVAQLRAEYFREQVQTMPIPYGGENLSLTVSIGISSYPKNGQTWEELYHAADLALYRSKQNGRNRVECA